MADAATHGPPRGLLVVTVIITVLPASAAAGVYIKENGVVFVEAGIKVPAPFSVNVTLVALPPNVLLVTVTDSVPHMLPPVLLRVRVGGLAHPHVTENTGPVVVHP